MPAPALVWLFSILLILAAHTAAAQASHTSHCGAVDVVMSLDQTSITVGTPINLNIKLINTTPAPLAEMRVNTQLSPGNGLEVTVQPQGELEYRYLGALQEGIYSEAPLMLRPGHPESLDTMLLFDRSRANGLLFDKPGTYMIAAVFTFNLYKNSEKVQATLPPTKMIVSEAQPGDAAVLKLLGHPKYLQALQLGVAPTTDTVSLFDKAATAYPKSSLGALALRAEGLTLAKSDVAADRELGAKLLQKFLKNGVADFDRDAVAWHIAAAYHMIKKYDLARAWIVWLVRNYPDSSRITDTDPLLNYYYLQPRYFAANNPWYLMKESWVVPGSQPPADLKPITEGR